MNTLARSRQTPGHCGSAPVANSDHRNHIPQTRTLRTYQRRPNANAGLPDVTRSSSP
ncbi:hypothetical protein IHE61_10355 [Streptomyces sp. GKU 257-1]|nr:hypothetical protein [Streptomyces sp. GKU 257-1]